VERHAYQLTDGTLEKWSPTWCRSTDRPSRSHERNRDIQNCIGLKYRRLWCINKYMKMITDVGAMATVGVSARGMKVSLRCVGSVDYSERLLSPVLCRNLLLQSKGNFYICDVHPKVLVLQMYLIYNSSSSFETYGSDGSHSYIRCTPESEYVYSWSIIWPRCTNFQVWKSRFKTYAKQCGAVNMHNLVAPKKNVSNESRWCRRTRFDPPEKEVTITCAEFWCPVSEVPMTQQQVQEKMEAFVHLANNR
jgi:hypothetical protein